MTRRVGSLILFVLFPIVIVSCDNGYSSYADPNMAALDARATIEAATAIARSTQEAEMRTAKASTLQAAETRQASEAEIALIEKQIEGTQVAIYAIQTVAESTSQVEARAAAAASTATAFSVTQTPLAATQGAIAARAQYEGARATIQPYGTVIVFIFTLYLLYKIITKLVDAMTLRYMVVDTYHGPIAVAPDGWKVHPQLLSANPPRKSDDVIPGRFREIPQAKRSPGGITWTAPIIDEDERTRRNLINFVKKVQAVAEANGYKDQFPSWRHLNEVNSSRYQRYIGLLEELGYVRIKPNVGTFTVGKDYDRILYELETMQDVKLSSPT